jgi:ferrochelatase
VDLPWLGPQIETLIPELSAAGERNLVVAPVGFIAEHVEVLYDLDIGAQEIARAHRARLERTPMLNDSDALVETLAHIASRKLRGTGYELDVDVQPATRGATMRSHAG